MPTIKRTIKVTTDGNGNYSTEEIINPPGFWDYNISATAKLVAPAATTISGTLEITAADGSTSNKSKDFSAATGVEIDLGDWKLDGGDNTIKVFGQTSPARAETRVEIEVTVKI